MKKLFILLVVLLASLGQAEAHPQPAITVYLQFCKTACIAKVTSITNGIATFEVEETIKGSPPHVLKLRIAEVPIAITPDSEWLLAVASGEDSVGWAMGGDYGWVNAPVRRFDGKIHLVGNFGYPIPELSADPTKGLTVEQMKELAQKPLPKQ
jgi:hypothetical protein